MTLKDFYDKYKDTNLCIKIHTYETECRDIEDYKIIHIRDFYLHKNEFFVDNFGGAESPYTLIFNADSDLDRISGNAFIVPHIAAFIEEDDSEQGQSLIEIFSLTAFLG